MRRYFYSDNPDVPFTQVTVCAWLNRLTEEDRIDTVMGFCSTQKAVLNWGDDYLPKTAPPEAPRG